MKGERKQSLSFVEMKAQKLRRGRWFPKKKSDEETGMQGSRQKN